MWKGLNMERVDIRVDIEFPMAEGTKPVIRTNANRDGLEEVLENWLYGQIGAGADRSEVTPHDVHHISIGLRLSDDTFFSSSDTGNKSVTCGMVREVFGQLGDLTILPLAV
jgi:hypothetical protein